MRRKKKTSVAPFLGFFVKNLLSLQSIVQSEGKSPRLGAVFLILNQLADCSGTRTHSHFVGKRTFDHFTNGNFG